SAEAEALLPHDILALARVFPVLRQVSAVNRARRAVLEIPDSQELRRRAFAALRELIVRLADRRPLVLFIDDLQWGDADSAALLEALLRPPDSPAVLLIGCYRSEEASTSPLLRVLLPMRDSIGPSLESHNIEVGELALPEARDLALALLGDPGPAMRTRAETIARESGGNPYFIEELVRFSQADTEQGAGAAFRGVAGGEIITPEFTFDRVIETRVSRLSEAARRLLDVVAVAGVPIEAGVAYRAANVETDGESALAPLRAAHLVRMRTTPGRHEIEAYHDRIRDAVVDHLSAELLRECHHRLASALLASGRPDQEMLATHYLGAGDAESAAEYATSAASKASQALAFDRAASLYQFALNLERRPLERTKLEIQLGDALANAGQGAEAARAYLSASAGAGSALAIDLHRRAAQQFLISGQIEDGIRVLDTVLAKLDMKLPETPRKALLSLLFRRAQIRLRGLRFRERDESEIAGQDLLRIDTCWAVGVGMSDIDMVRGADFQARHLLLALRAGEPYRVARALAMEGAYVAMGGNRSRARAEQLIQASRMLAERVKHPYALGLSTMTAGNAAWLDGRWRDARALCERAEQTLRERCTGAVWEILLAQVFGLASMFFLGEVAALSQRLFSLLEEAMARGNLLRATFLRIGFCSHMAWLAADDAGRARQELEAGLEGWTQGRFDYLQLWARSARTDIALYSGESTLLPERVAPQWRLSARALDRFVQAGFIRGLDQRARRRLATAAESQSPRVRDALLRGAERHARTILGERTRWGDPLAFLLQAGAAATRGKTERALALLSSAESGFAGADMALYLAAVQRRRGQLMGGDEGRSLVDTASAWMAGQSIKNPERMTAMLAPGRWSAV
ncbi:MAG TPA: AAA family ATPase, partial [Vicinamibacteria bacterium]|nr:AAA family ATPase [Vicinamibacteria bacterium]